MAIIVGRAITKAGAQKIAARERRKDKNKKYQFRVVKSPFKDDPYWRVAMTVKGTK